MRPLKIKRSPGIVVITGLLFLVVGGVEPSSHNSLVLLRNAKIHWAATD